MCEEREREREKSYKDAIKRGNLPPFSAVNTGVVRFRERKIIPERERVCAGSSKHSCQANKVGPVLWDNVMTWSSSLRNGPIEF